MTKILIALCLIFSAQLNAQEIPKKHKFVADTTYIKSLSEKLIVKLLSDTNFDTYTIKQDDKSYQIVPNLRGRISLGFVYHFIIVNISVPKRYIPYTMNEEKMGTTESFVFGIGFFYRKWYQYFYYNDTKGYYLANTDQYVQGWTTEDPYTTFPTLRNKKIESTTYYIIDAERFSYRSFLHQNQIQKKSAGSFIPLLNLTYLYRTSDEEISIGMTENTSNIYSVGGMLGYQYNWIPIKSLNISGGAYFGGGLRVTNYYDANGENKKYNSSVINSSANLHLIYQHKNTFFGGKIILKADDYQGQENTSILNMGSYTVIFLGYRFNPPKFLDKGYHKIFKH